jgi:hypothetical protein
VDQRRRGRKWRIILGVGALAVVAALIILSLYYKGRWARRSHPRTHAPSATAVVAPTTAATAVAPPTAAETNIRTLVINSTKVPQRYGNALAALEQFNVAAGNLYRLEQSRPKIPYGGRSGVYFRPGFESEAGEMAKALGSGVNRARVDLTITCGQDISKLILEAMAKNVPAAEGCTVEVLNGSGIEGAAAKMKERLEANGYRVVAVGNAASFDFKKTVIEAPADENDAALKMAALFGLGEAVVEPASYDIKVVIGDDYGVTPAQP